MAPFLLERYPMDLKQYYRKMREIEKSLAEPYVLIVSLETADGGKAGVVSEVPREIAAKTIVESRAVLATEDDRNAYRKQQAAAQKAAHKAELSRRVQVAIIADSDIEPAVPGKKISNGDK